jgi:hypothetical protein
VRETRSSSRHGAAHSRGTDLNADGGTDPSPHSDVPPRLKGGEFGPRGNQFLEAERNYCGLQVAVIDVNDKRASFSSTGRKWTSQPRRCHPLDGADRIGAIA